MSHGMSRHGEPLDLKPIDSVSTLLSNIKRIKEYECSSSRDIPLRYYRGLSQAHYPLKPSVMRCKKHFKNEGHMLRELITRRPDEFSRHASALDRWMLAQHYDLYTRFLDISMNPLIGLFFACGGNNDNNDAKGEGLLYVFSTTRSAVKPYDSDSVSIIANFARLRGCEQKWILKMTRNFLLKRCAFVDLIRGIMHPNEIDDKRIKEVKDYAVRMECLREENEASGRFSYMGRLQTFIKQGKAVFCREPD